MIAAKTLLMALAIADGISLFAQTAERHDVVITEIMADPSPVVGLPAAEFIEIRNVSSTPFNLKDWQLSDASGTSVISTSYVLQPDSILILCANSNVATFSSYGKAIGISPFPSLDNAGEMLSLYSPQNRTICAVHYSDDWYGNESKKDGGWSLEMIDTKNPCGGNENWKESTSNLGGTPGKINSVDGKRNDNSPPQVIKAYATDSVTVVIVFNEPLDSNSAAPIGHYSLPGFTIAAANPLKPLFQSLQLKLNAPMQRGNVYNLTINNITDCKGNAIGAFNKTKIGLPQPAATNDLVINEVLFNPRPGAFDYVEFYNRSQKIIDASLLSIASRASSGLVSSARKLSPEPFYLLPGDYFVATENKASLQKEYLVKKENAVSVISSLPSFPDERGTVVLLNFAGDVLDEVAYDKKWHFALLDNSEGVALERVDPDAPSQNRSSWHSASATSGYGTPTYINSQFKREESVLSTIDISPAVFSPDNDGRDDIATIHYQLSETGYVANVSIFDASGRLVRYLVKNDLLGLKGFWKWDGLGEKLNKLPIGTYIVYTELFNLQGKKKSFRNTIVLARRLN